MPTSRPTRDPSPDGGSNVIRLPTADASPKPKGRPKRDRSGEHPGVRLHDLPPHPATGLARKLMRWRDPRTGKGCKKTLVGLSDSECTACAIEQYAAMRDTRARQQRDATREGRAERAGRAKPKPDAERRTIDDACRAYYRSQAVPNASRHTLARIDEHLLVFQRWCRAQGLGFLDEIDQPTLRRFYDWRAAQPKRGGGVLKPNALNTAVAFVRAALNSEYDAGRAPHLNKSVTSKGLPRIGVTSSRDRQKHGVISAFRLDVRDLQALLTAAIAYDLRRLSRRRVSVYRSVAVDIAVMLLCGFRNEEYTFARCVAAHCDPLEGWGVEVSGKGFETRGVYMRGFTAVGADILTALAGDRGDDEWLSGNAYSSFANHLGRVAKWAGLTRKVSPHDLRATTATYQLAIAGMSPARAYARLGHDGEVAHNVYIRWPKGMKFNAESLEDAMECKPQFQAILDAYRSGSFGAPRDERRPRKTSRNSQVLLSDDPSLLADALNPHPAKVRGAVVS